MPARPTDTEIEYALRAAVRSALDTGETTSVNIARAAAEKELGLEDGFLKSDGGWKTRSKDIVNNTVNEEEQSAPPTPAKNTTKARSAPKPKVDTEPSRKRSKVPAAKSRKRQKKDDTESEANLSDLSEPLSESEAEASLQPSPKATTKPAAKTESDTSELSEHPVLESEDVDDTKKPSNGIDDSESELSDVIDEPAPKKKRASSATKKAPKSTRGSKVKPSKTSSKDQDLSPDQAEIKRLQGWLVKCGIRKIWGIYLKPYETDKAKIKHLKGMLDEAGMTGRYSIEKASAIKEARELAADLEAVQEGEKQWGENKDKSSESESEDNAPARPPRRNVASRFVDFGNEDEDSD
ncbi:HIRA-interacting protein 3 [Elsinoe australis]|uniref:HIRA-interacting protein 3 n=1 Tax=Elsinoe australis TaxID=40998 RepID=A0A2P7ZDQ3_9PEZI|nr:HIRA-interacting protein 3 [Elsinoe australis]